MVVAIISVKLIADTIFIVVVIITVIATATVTATAVVHISYFYSPINLSLQP